MPKTNDSGVTLTYMKALAHELRGIAFHIENTNVTEYGNNGCANGKYKLLDDCGQTHARDIKTLRKVADLFEKVFGPTLAPTDGENL